MQISPNSVALRSEFHHASSQFAFKPGYQRLKKRCRSDQVFSITSQVVVRLPAMRRPHFESMLRLAVAVISLGFVCYVYLPSRISAPYVLSNGLLPDSASSNNLDHGQARLSTEVADEVAEVAKNKWEVANLLNGPPTEALFGVFTFLNPQGRLLVITDFTSVARQPSKRHPLHHILPQRRMD